MTKDEEVTDPLHAQLAEIDRVFDRLERSTLIFTALVILAIFL